MKIYLIVSAILLALGVAVVALLGVFAYKNKALVMAFSSPEARSAFTACASEQGKMQWITMGIFMLNPPRRLECVTSFEDGGKACTDGSECNSRGCLAKDQRIEKGAAANGTCARSSEPLPCTTTVTAGKSNGESLFCDAI